MTCQTIQDILLTDYIDGLIDSERKKTVDDHLLLCAACREFWAHARGMNDLLRQAPSAVPSFQVWENISQRIEDRPVSWYSGLRYLWNGALTRTVLAVSTTCLMVALIVSVTLPGAQLNKSSGIQDKDLVALIQVLDEPVPGEDISTEQTVVDYFLEGNGTFTG